MAAERVVRIEGMHCGSCAKLVEMALREIPGVSSAAVGFESGRAVVTHDGSVADEAIGRAVSETGYTAAF